MKISLCMIVKNEEKNIINCLERALEVVDEAIIVDTGSIDNTKELVEKQFADDSRIKLVDYLWENDFSAARNESLKYATGDWILILDADERLFADRKEIEELLNTRKDRAYIIPIYNILDRENLSISSSMVRLFKNDHPHYHGAIHEQLALNGESFMPDVISSDICKIYHYGYTKEVFEEKDKQNRNMTIIDAELEQNPHDPFNWYNKGVMEMIRENYETAIDDFLKSHNLTHGKRMAFHNDLVVKVLQCMMMAKKYKKSIEFVKIIQEDPYLKKIPDPYYYAGIAYAKLKKYPKAIKYFKTAIEVGEYDKGISKLGAGSFLPMLEWARILLLEKKTDLAIKKYKEAIFDSNNVNHQGLDELKLILEQKNLTDEMQQLEKNTKEGQVYMNEQISLEELENYKNGIKDNIRAFIENGMLEDAKELIQEYEKIVHHDADIYSMKSVIAMMEGDLNEAERSVDIGLSLDPNNQDLIYNKAFILEQVGNFKGSYKKYKELLDSSTNQQVNDDIEKKLRDIISMDPYADLSGKISVLAISEKLDDQIGNYIVNWFHEYGFTVLKEIKGKDNIIENDDAQRYILLYDLNPVEMSVENKIKVPDIDNERYFLIQALGQQLLVKFGLRDMDSYLSLSPNEKAAKDTLVMLIQDELPALYKRIRKIELDYETKYPVLKLFDGFRHRAKTELIEYRGEVAVKKTWKPGNEKFCQREKFAYGELSKAISYIPPLLEGGENYIIIPYYKDILNQSELTKKRILTTYIVDVASFFKQLYDAGYFNPDIHPGQFIFSEQNGLIALDFEYLQPYENKPNSFLESYDIMGYPKDFNGDKPNYVGENLHKLYDQLWVRYTGYTLNQIASLVTGEKYQHDDPEINKVLGLLNYAKTSGKSYDGSLYGSAYHSLTLKEYYFRGQRECNIRLQKVPYDFSNKVVLDIGCNAGGMLHAISSKIKAGIGIDYDYRLVNAANAIKAINKSHNLSFYRFDLENEDLNLIKNFVISNDGGIDICFLLSVCMWIENWREVIAYVASISNNLLFETNGTQDQQEEQIAELEKNYEQIKIIEEVSNDDPGQPNRQLLFCKKKRT